MADPISCPHCQHTLTDVEVRTLHQRYASSQRKTKRGGRRFPAPPLPPLQPTQIFTCQTCGHTYFVRKPISLLVKGHDGIKAEFGPALDPGCPRCAERTLATIDET